MTLTNPDAEGTLLALGDAVALPPELAATAGASSCGGGLRVEGGTVTLNDARLDPGTSCAFAFDVTAQAPGDFAIPGGVPHAANAEPGVAGSGAVLAVRAVPVIDAVTPAIGPAAGGTRVTIRGAHFDGVGGVRFGAVPAASWTRDAAEQISAVSPASAAGSVRVSVETEGGETADDSAARFRFREPPAAPVIASPAADAVLVEPMPRFAGSAEPGTTVTLTIDGAPAGNAGAGEEGAWSIGPTASLLPGAHVAQAIATADGLEGPPSPPLRFTLAAPLAARVSVPVVTARIGTPLALAPVTASGGAGTLAFALGGAALPPGLNFAADGQLSGTPAAALATTRFAVTVTDAAGQRAEASFELTVARAAQTLAFTSTPPADATVGGAPYAPAVTASSGLVPALSTAAPAVCAFRDGAVRLLAPGTCTIFADQPGDARWEPAPRAEQRFEIAPETLFLTVRPPAIARVAQPYARASSATGGVPPYHFAIGEGALPSGLAIDATTGSVTGTPLRAGPYGYRVRVDDAAGANATQWVTGMIAKGEQSLAFTSAPPEPAQVDGPAYLPVAAAGSGLAITLAIDPASAAICSLEGGSVRFAARGVCVLVARQDGDDDWLAAAPVEQRITVDAAALTLASTSPGDARVGARFQQNNAAAGGVAPYGYALASGALPAGTALDTGTGQVEGSPTRAGPFRYTIAVRDARNVEASGTVVEGMIDKGAQDIVFATAAPVTPRPGGPDYNPVARASSGLATQVSIEPGAAATCALADGAVRFLAAGSCTLRADQPGDDDWNPAPPARQSIAVLPESLALTAEPFASAQVARDYAQPNRARGGVAPYRFALASGALPVGLTLDAQSGSVTGRPARAGAFGYTLRVADTGGQSATGAPVQGVIAKGDQLLAFATAPPRDARVGGTYRPELTVTSGLVAVMSVEGGACQLAGATVEFVTAGNCTLRATQSGDVDWSPAPDVEQRFEIGAAALLIEPAPVQGDRVGVAFAQANVARGGTVPYAFALAEGALPEGTALDAVSGAVTGTLRRARPYRYRISVRDADGVTAIGTIVQGDVAKGEQAVTFASTPPSDARVGGEYRPVAAASSGLTATLSAQGACTLDGELVRFGARGSCTVRAAQAGDADWNPAPDAEQRVLVEAAALRVDAAPASGDRVGAAFVQLNAANGGTAPYAYALAEGALPVGAMLDPGSGAISGTLRRAGAYRYIVGARDADGASATGAAVQGVIGKGDQVLTFTSTPPGDARVGSAYRPIVEASSGLVAMLSTDGAACMLDGDTVRFVAAGRCVIRAAQLGDADWNAAVAVEQRLVVGAAVLLVEAAGASGDRVGTAFAQANAARGGTAPYSYAIGEGALPDGAVLDPANGSVSGTLRRAEPYRYSVSARDADGVLATGTPVQGSIGKGDQQLVFSTAIPADARVGGSHAPAAAVRSGLAVVLRVDSASAAVCELRGGTLGYAAPGLCLLHAEQPGDADWEPAAAEQRITVAGLALTLTSEQFLGAQVGASYRHAHMAAGGSPPYSFAVASGALPLGTLLDAASGLVSGTPIKAGPFGYALSVRDAAGATQTAPPIAGTIAKGEQMIRFAAIDDIALSGHVTLDAAASSGLPIAFETQTPAVCMVHAAAVALQAPGQCIVVASQAGDETWNAAAPVERRFAVLALGGLASLTVSGGSLVPTFDSDTLRYAATLDGAIDQVTITAVPRDAAATLSIDGEAGATRTLRVPAGAKTVAIDVTSAGMARRYTIDFARAKADQTLRFTSVPPDDAATGDAGYAPQAAADSGLPVMLTAAPANVCGLEGGVVRYLAAGTCVIRAEQAGDSAWNAATPIEQRFAIVVKEAPPRAGDVEASTAFATPATIDLAGLLAGGPATEVIADAPAHGTVSVTGMRIVYTPAAGFHGADRFGYRVSGPGGRSNDASITVRVAPPEAPVVQDRRGVAVPFGSAGATIDLAALVRGTHTGFTLVDMPSHGTATIDGVTARYVPRAGYHGIDQFGFAANGPGGASNVGTVELVVGTPEAPIAADRTGLAVAYESEGEAIDLYASITGAFTAVEIVRAPAHGSATVQGGIVTYRPAADFSGADGFGYRAIGPGGRSAEASVQLVVGTPLAPAVQPGSGAVVSATGARNGSVEIDLAALVSGEFDRVEITSPPRNGSVELIAGRQARAARSAPAALARYTPSPGFVGTDSFTFAARSRGGASPPAEVVITVTGSRPAVQAKALAAGDGQTISVDLTGDAEEGPFTAAAIVDVDPAQAASARIFSPGVGHYRLDVTTSPRFGGTVRVRYTLANAHGVSDPGIVTLQVRARSDPSGDADLRALSDAQGEAARRFARTQAGNFLRRAEQLHGEGGGSAMNLRLASRDPAAPRPPEQSWDRAIVDRIRGVAPEAVEPVGSPGGLGRLGPIALWTSGAIDIATLDPLSGRAKISASTAGLSGGADLRLIQGVSVGVGGGYAGDRSIIGGGGARLRSESGLLAAYASLTPIEGAFLDLVVGRGTLRFTTQRSVAEIQATAVGRRSGGYDLAAFSAGIERRDAAFGWALYGRGEYMDAWLDAYREDGAGRHDLRFDARRLRSITATLGGRIDYRQLFAWGAVTPRLRAEWSRELSEASAQGLDYADILADSLFQLEAGGWQREQLSVVLGTRFDLPFGWSFDLETGLRTAAGERAMLLRLLLILTF